MPDIAALPSPTHMPETTKLPAVLCVAIIFIAYSLIRFPIPSVNEPHYLCKARSFADSAWCKGDFFLESSNAHAVFFALVGPITQWLTFEAVAIAGRIVSLTLLAYGWMSVSYRLHNLRWSGVVAAPAFCGLAMTGNFSGEWVVGGFESKVPAYGFSLIAVALWLDARQSPTAKRYLSAGVFSGLAMALHPVVGAWFCVGIALSECVCWCIDNLRYSAIVNKVHKTNRPAKHRALPALLGHGAVFFASGCLVALPGIIPAITSALATKVSSSQSDQANQIQVFWRLAHHLDPSTFPRSAWLHTAGLLSCVAAGSCVLYRRRFGTKSSSPQSNLQIDASSQVSNWTSVWVLLTMSLLIAATGIAIGWHSGPATEMEALSLRTTLLKFYPFRFFDALLPMVASWVLACLVLSCLPKRPGIHAWAALAMSLAIVPFAAQKRIAVPSGYTAASFQSWKDACVWLQKNTDPDCLIYGPREGFGLKWYAERPEYVCFKDCPQDAAGILEWNRRLWVMHNWAQASWKDGKCDDTDLQLLNHETGITHILTRRLGPFQSSPVFQTGSWKVYNVSTTTLP